MANIAKSLICLSLLFACACVGKVPDASDSRAQGSAERYVASELLVQFRLSLEDERPQQLVKLHGGEIVQCYAAFPGMALVRFSKETELSAVHELFDGSQLVEAVSYNFIRQMKRMPNDPLVGVDALWALNNTGQLGGSEDADIDAFEAWDSRTDAADVIVAIIDTGVRYTHEDLADNMWVNAAEIPGNGVDDDGNGYVDDVHGINASNGSGDPMDDQGHGTHVAGIVGAVGDNGLGVSGVAWDIKLMALKFLDATGDGSDADAIECIDYSITNGARVINNSWGAYTRNQLIENAIQEANAAGVFFVAAAGNASGDNDDRPNYPASYDVPNIVSVTATDRHDKMAKFASFGERSVDIAAPGVSIYSTYFEDDSDYRQLNGTSMAAPHVSGAIALLASEFPGDSMVAILNRLYSSVDPLESLARRCRTGGRLNLERALLPQIQPPLNDQFAKAAILFNRSTSLNESAGSEFGEPVHAPEASGKSVWWKWTPTADGLVNISTAGSDFRTVVAVYSGGSMAELAFVSSDQDESSETGAALVSFEAYKNIEYIIAVDGVAGEVGNISLSLGQAVANDNFASRAILPEINYRTTENNFSATAEVGEPNHGGAQASRSLWWSFTSIEEGEVAVSTSSSGGFDSLLGVYRGSSLEQLELVAEDDDDGPGWASETSFVAKSGETFSIAVDGWQGSFGDVALTIASGENYTLRKARTIEEDSFEDYAYNKSAIKEAAEPDHAGNEGGHSLWWHWSVGRTGNAFVSTFGSDFDTTLAVYSGNGYGDLVELGSSDDIGGSLASRVDFEATAGENYLIAVDGYRSSGGLDFGMARVSGEVVEFVGKPEPIIEAFPSFQGEVGESFSLQLVASEMPTSFTATGLPQGLAINETTGLVTGIPEVSGNFHVHFEAENQDGVGTYSKRMTIAPSADSPRMIASPRFKGGVVGESLRVETTAAGVGNLTYQWYKDGAIVPGESGPDLDFVSLSAADAGVYTVMVSSAAGAVLSDEIVVSAFDESLANISTRGIVGVQDSIMIAGFVITGDSPRTLLIRAVGKTLEQFNVAGVIGNPQVHIIRGQDIIDYFDDWKSESNHAEIASVSEDLGAFPLTSDQDAAKLVTLDPGGYTVFISGVGGDTGIALAEVYDASRGEGIETRLINISTRLNVKVGDGVAIGGFVIDGDEPKKVLIRAVGPGLEPANIGQPLLPDPFMEVYSGGVLIDRNDDWKSEGTDELKRIFDDLGAFDLEENSSDAAMVRELEPGGYTVIVRDFVNREGLCLIEVYELR